MTLKREHVNDDAMTQPKTRCSNTQEPKKVRIEDDLLHVSSQRQQPPQQQEDEEAGEEEEEQDDAPTTDRDNLMASG